MAITILAGIIFSYDAAGIDLKNSKVLIDYDFNQMKTYAPWIGWSLKPQKIQLVKDSSGLTVLQYKGEGWNTPILPLKPSITVTDMTALVFRAKTSRAGGWEINLRNETEDAEYVTGFSVTKENEWINIVVLLKDAAYKRFGKDGVIHDGLLGDKLSRVQLAYRGKEITLADFKIVNINPKDVDSASTQFSEIKEYLATYQSKSYPKLTRNGIFPFGVIVTLNRECKDNANFFNQTLLKRYEMALQDIKSRGFNTVSNFCNAICTGDNLELMKKYNLFLLETATCGANVHALPDSAPLINDIEKYSYDPNLLAWYGQDEPSNIKRYLKNKKRVETVSAGGSPYTSAMHMNYIVKNVGPCMEVIIIDPYSLTEDFDPVKSSHTLLKHQTNIKLARESSNGKWVWMIPQAFGMRGAGKRTLRYPRPEEIRLEIFNALASGVKGFIFFIYNDSVPYLDKQIRGEEFDQTLVDAWYNGNPLTDELSKLAKRLIPIMPSFLDSEPTHDLTITCSNGDARVEQWKNKFGTLIYCYNSNLTRNAKGTIKVALPSGVKLFNTESLEPVDHTSKFDLAPGDGKILLAASPGNFAIIAKEISYRRSEFDWQQLDLRLNELDAAGFDVGSVRKALDAIKPVPENYPSETMLNKLDTDITALRNSNKSYCDSLTQLQQTQRRFGRINSALTASGTIERIDANPEWYQIFDSIQKSSTQYFKYYNELTSGHPSFSAADLVQLDASVEKLEKEILEKLKK